MFDFIILILSLAVIIKSADYASKYAVRIANLLKLPKYVIGFLILAVISILPETFISIESAIKGIPSFGLGTLIGSNVADISLVFAIIILTASREIKIRSKILENNKFYPLLLSIPIVVGFDGYYSRVDGLFLLLSGIYFIFWTLRKNQEHSQIMFGQKNYLMKDIGFLSISMFFLFAGSSLTVTHGVSLANSIGISPIIVAMFLVGLGTTLPELVFSLRAVKNNRDDLALGDILGTVVSDATIVIGILALISPFSFPVRIIYITATFMVLASLLLMKFMRSERALTKKEGFILLFFYMFFALVEYLQSINWF